KISQMARATTRLATRKSDSVESKPGTMAYNISGWTPAASTNQIQPNSRRLSILCSTGIAMQLDATAIYRMFRQPSLLGNLLFGQANGLPAVGRFKSFLHLGRSNFSLKKASGLVTSAL